MSSYEYYLNNNWATKALSDGNIRKREYGQCGITLYSINAVITSAT